MNFFGHADDIAGGYDNFLDYASRHRGGSGPTHQAQARYYPSPPPPPRPQRVVQRNPRDNENATRDYVKIKMWTIVPYGPGFKRENKQSSIAFLNNPDNVIVINYFYSNKVYQLFPNFEKRNPIDGSEVIKTKEGDLAELEGMMSFGKKKKTGFDRDIKILRSIKTPKK